MFKNKWLKMKNKTYLFLLGIIFFLLIFLPFVSAINISGNEYRVSSSTFSLQGGNATGSIYDPRTLLTFNTGGDVLGSVYQGNIGFIGIFRNIIVEEEEEVPPVVPPVSPTGGSGSGGGPSGKVIIPTMDSFSVDTEQIKVSLTPGSITTRNITITNKLDKKIILNLKTENIENFLFLKENKIELNPYESKTIFFDILVREDVTPDLYVGNLRISYGNEKKVLFIIEVESKGALFDLRVKIPDEYLNMLPGKEVLAEIELFNLGEVKRADVELEYTIEDSQGNKVTKKKETMAIETQASFIRKIKIPTNVKGGKHILYIKVIYNEKSASATAEFNVINIKTTKIYIIIIIISIMLISSVIKRKEMKNIMSDILKSDILKK